MRYVTNLAGLPCRWSCIAWWTETACRVRASAISYTLPSSGAVREPVCSHSGDAELC